MYEFSLDLASLSWIQSYKVWPFYCLPINSCPSSNNVVGAVATGEKLNKLQEDFLHEELLSLSLGFSIPAAPTVTCRGSIEPQ